ncbi:unnamed protein product [Urochloa humidicola]
MPKAMAQRRRRRVRKIRRTLPAGDGGGAAAELRPHHGGCEPAARSPCRELVLGGGAGAELLQHSECLLNPGITQVVYLH